MPVLIFVCMNLTLQACFYERTHWTMHYTSSTDSSDLAMPYLTIRVLSFRAQKACNKNMVCTDPDTGVKTSMSPSNFCHPNFRRMGTYERTIRLLGNVILTSTGYGERSHTDIKHTFPSTNKRSSATIDEQVISQLQSLMLYTGINMKSLSAAVHKLMTCSYHRCWILKMQLCHSQVTSCSMTEITSHI